MLTIEIGAERIFTVFGFPVTNTLLMSWLVIALLATGAILLSRRLALFPSGGQNLIELGMERFLKLMEGVFGSREQAEKYFPIVATIFIFILISNWLGIFPGIGSIGFREVHEGKEVFVPILRSSASDLNVTLALAIVAVALVNIFGVTAIGFGKHLSRFFSFRSPVDFIVDILEFISEIAKMVSFSFRLFGNIFAGEVLLLITGFLVPYLVPVPFLILEIFVGFVQALVFAMLTMVFISIAVAHQ